MKKQILIVFTLYFHLMVTRENTSEYDPMGIVNAVYPTVVTVTDWQRVIITSVSRYTVALLQASKDFTEFTAWCTQFARSDSVPVHRPSSAADSADRRVFSSPPTWRRSSLSLSGRADFPVTGVHPAACLRCRGAEACFQLSSLFHTKRERERNERLRSCLCLSI